ncbi:MAG: DNA polymerase/3'-5' exonuclease PolX [Pirellulaceae bacterium]
MTNDRLAAAFEEMGDILEFQGANPFRVRAYRNAARTLRDYPESIPAIVAEGTRPLTDIEGIGKDLADKITTLVRTGELPPLNELRSQVPESVLHIMRIPGIGPKKAAALHRELKVQTLEQLRAACEAGAVRVLKGFGAKTEELILKGIHIAATAQLRLYWSDADHVAGALRAYLGKCDAIQQLEVAGSYRRGRETVGDLDLLVVSPEPDRVMDHFGQFPELATVLARGETKMSIRTHRGLQVDLRVVAAESFGAALQYFTGSKDHNVILRGLARQRGLKINEYGVFRLVEGREEYVAGATEEDVYTTLGLPLFPPELREARREFEWAAAGALPELVDVGDLRGDLHMHTQASDGHGSLEEMAEAAFERGLKYIAITDHSQRVSMARGLNPARLLEQWRQIDDLNERLAGRILVLKGIECDILEKGGMDLPDDVLAQADWVLASVHYGQKQPRQQITDRILGALENPYVSAIAHPTGRLINQREPYDVDLDAVLAAAKRHCKVLELNANPARLDLNDVHCAAAKSLGVPIVINTDAHSTDGLDCLRYGVIQARRGGLTRHDVANARTWPQLKKLLRGHAAERR